MQEFTVRIQEALSKSLFISEAFAHGPLAALFFMLYVDTVGVRPETFNGDVLIADRGIDSIAIYQGTFVGTKEAYSAVRLLATIEDLFSELGMHLPDLTILLTLPINIVKERFESTNGRRLSNIEVERICAFQDLYLQLAATKKRFIVLDADRELHSVVDHSADAIFAFLAEGKKNDST